MIPKIAHFHWTGPPMSWLRMASIATFVKHNPDWEVRVVGTPPEIRKYGLMYGQEADWTWWKQLYEVGGFQVATDIVFIKSVPESWLYCEMNACTNSRKVIHQFAMMGSKPGHPFFRKCIDHCMDMAINKKVDGYQALGVDMLKKVPLPQAGFFDQPMDALCPMDCGEIDKLWSSEWFDLPEETIGVHWYGAYPRSASGQDGRDQNAFIIRLAEEELGDS